MFLDDSHLNNSIFSTVCSYCRHFNIDSAIEEIKTCMAFPGGIPEEIWRGENTHQQPYPGDSGITFARRNE